MLYLTPFTTAYFLVLAFLLGAIFASFLGCMGWRMSHGESVLHGRSHCDSCGHILSGRDLIPIFSYIARGGKCAYCGAPIPKSSLIGEILLATLFVLATLRWDITPKLVLMLSFICILYLLSLVDIYIQEIPDSCHVIAIGMRLIYYFIFEGFQLDSFLYLVASGFSVALPLLVLTLIMEKIMQREAMGGGDIKLIFVTGLYLGWESNLFMILVACIVGIVVGLVQGQSMTVTEASEESEESEEVAGNYFPFGPAIAIATVFCLFFGNGIVSWYLSLF